MIKIIFTRCYIFRLKCNKFDFGWGSVPDPAGRAHSAHTFQLDSRGSTSKGKRKVRGKEEERERKGERERKKRVREERAERSEGDIPPFG